MEWEEVEVKKLLISQDVKLALRIILPTAPQSARWPADEKQQQR